VYLLLPFLNLRTAPHFRTSDSYVRFEDFTAVAMKNAVFWDVTQCGSCEQTFRRNLQEPHGIIPEDVILHRSDSSFHVPILTCSLVARHKHVLIFSTFISRPTFLLASIEVYEFRNIYSFYVISHWIHINSISQNLMCPIKFSST
jgi:hypothetical protein